MNIDPDTVNDVTARFELLAINSMYEAAKLGGEAGQEGFIAVELAMIMNRVRQTAEYINFLVSEQQG